MRTSNTTHNKVIVLGVLDAAASCRLQKTTEGARNPFFFEAEEHAILPLPLIFSLIFRAHFTHFSRHLARSIGPCRPEALSSKKIQQSYIDPPRHRRHGSYDPSAPAEDYPDGWWSRHSSFPSHRGVVRVGFQRRFLELRLLL